MQNSKLPYQNPSKNAPLKLGNGLQKCAISGLDTSREVNVYDVITKEIVYTGTQTGAARFMGMPGYGPGTVPYCLNVKSVYKKKYAVRYVKTQNG